MVFKAEVLVHGKLLRFFAVHSNPNDPLLSNDSNMQKTFRIDEKLTSMCLKFLPIGFRIS